MRKPTDGGSRRVVDKDLESFRLASDGFERFSAALDESDVEHLLAVIGDMPANTPGIRLFGCEALNSILEASGAVGAVANVLFNAPAQPVRVVVFDKTRAANWSLPWHQDRTIAVRERVDVEGFGPWTVKQGLVHVAPPFEVLAGMVTLRVHLDPTPVWNAPLLVAPGSHRRGRIAEPDIPRVVAECGSVACLAGAGDIWAYATPILHASAAAARPARRRVLQVDYAGAPLRGGLSWLGT